MCEREGFHRVQGLLTYFKKKLYLVLERVLKNRQPCTLQLGVYIVMAFLRDNFIIHKFLNMWRSDPLILGIYPKYVLCLQKFMQKESLYFL